MCFSKNFTKFLKEQLFCRLFELTTMPNVSLPLTKSHFLLKNSSLNSHGISYIIDGNDKTMSLLLVAHFILTPMDFYQGLGSYIYLYLSLRKTRVCVFFGLFSFKPFFGYFLLLSEIKTELIQFCTKFQVKQVKFSASKCTSYRNCLLFFQKF